MALPWGTALILLVRCVSTRLASWRWGLLVLWYDDRSFTTMGVRREVEAVGSAPVNCCCFGAAYPYCSIHNQYQYHLQYTITSSLIPGPNSTHDIQIPSFVYLLLSSPEKLGQVSLDQAELVIGPGIWSHPVRKLIQSIGIGKPIYVIQQQNSLRVIPSYSHLQFFIAWSN